MKRAQPRTRIAPLGGRVNLPRSHEVLQHAAKGVGGRRPGLVSDHELYDLAKLRFGPRLAGICAAAGLSLGLWVLLIMAVKALLWGFAPAHRPT